MGVWVEELQEVQSLLSLTAMTWRQCQPCLAKSAALVSIGALYSVIHCRVIGDVLKTHFSSILLKMTTYLEEGSATLATVQLSSVLIFYINRLIRFSTISLKRISTRLVQVEYDLHTSTGMG